MPNTKRNVTLVMTVNCINGHPNQVDLYISELGFGGKDVPEGVHRFNICLDADKNSCHECGSSLSYDTCKGIGSQILGMDWTTLEDQVIDISE